MHLLRKLLSDRRVRFGLACVIAVTLAAGVLAWKMGVDLEVLGEAWKKTKSYLVGNPWMLFWALVILPGLPIPSSALYLAAGIVWGGRPVMACALYLLAMTLNLTWTYWLAASPARRLVERLLATSAIQIPDLPRGDHLKLILVLKLTPGIPFFFQNYLLGFLRAPFLLFLPLSILCNGVIGIGIVLSGVGIGDGKLVPALTGISLIALGVVLTQLVRGWLAKRKTSVETAETLNP
jgi:uncharacterized membrane protein YdjX (TVP38/TMEM64 family)